MPEPTPIRRVISCLARDFVDECLAEAGVKRQQPALPAQRPLRPHCLYRYFDAEGRLLYIGISVNPGARDEDHRRKSWYRNVARCAHEWLPQGASPYDVERAAIRSEKPLHNIIGNGK